MQVQSTLRKMSGPPRVEPTAKDRYLRVAAEIAQRTTVGQLAFPFVVSHITIEDTAKAMGVGRSRLYKLWPSKIDFWVDVIKFVAVRDLAPSALGPDFVVGDAAELSRGLEPARRAMNGVQEWARNDSWMALNIALAGYPDNERLATFLAETRRQGVAGYARLGEGALIQLRRAPIEPLVVDDLAVWFDCVLEGVASSARLTARVDALSITLDDDAVHGPYGLLSYAHRCMLQRLTEPSERGVRATSTPADGAVSDVTWTKAQTAVLMTAASMLASALRGDASGGDRGTSAPLGYVTIDRVARRAGVTRQAIQRVWSSQHDLRNDLMRHLHRLEAQATVAVLRRALREGYQAGADGMLIAAERLIAHQVAVAESSPLSYLAYSSHYHDRTIREIGRLELEMVLEQCANDLDLLFRAWRCRPRRGVTSFHIAALMLPTVQAVGRLHRTNPELLRQDLPFRNGRWSAMAIILHEVVAASLEPIDGSGPPLGTSSDRDR